MIADGTLVQVRRDWPEAHGRVHIRTPHYLRGRTGRVLRHLGDYPNPEALAFARPAEILPLYHVVFEAAPIWPDTTAADLIVEIYEPWLQV